MFNVFRVIGRAFVKVADAIAPPLTYDEMVTNDDTGSGPVSVAELVERVKRDHIARPVDGDGLAKHPAATVSWITDPLDAPPPRLVTATEARQIARDEVLATLQSLADNAGDD